MRNKNYQRILGIHIYNYRTKKNMKQGELAYKAERSEEYISRLENGNHEPCARTLYMLSQALDIDLNQLLDDVETETKHQYPNDKI